MPGKKISDLDVYDDVNTDKSRRDLLEISKNTGTYGSPTYATNGSRKITIEQLKETLFIKDINSYNQVTTGSPTFDKQSYNGIANAGTYTLPTSVGSYEVLAIILEAELNVTVNGLGTGISDLVFTKQNETAYLIDTVYGWYPLAVNKEVNSSAFELLANKENTTLDTSSTKYPTNNLVKTYVDNLGNTLTSGLATKLTIANNLSDLTNTTQARDNLFLGATNDVTHNSITLSNTTVSTLPFIDSAKKIISATGALLGTWFQTLTADTNPVDADTIVVNDSVNSFEAKKTTLLQLWSNYIKTKADSVYLLLTGGTLTGALNYPSFTTLASASTTNIGGVNNNYIEITGTTNITSFGTSSAGVVRILRFTGILTISHNGISLILPNGTDVTTKANDIIEMTSLGSGNWICTSITQGSLGNYVDLSTSQTITGQKTFSRDTGSPTTGTATGTIITQLDCARIINSGKYIFYVSGDNVSIGKNAGHGSASFCTSIGASAGNWSMSGQQNTLFGYQAGNVLSSGSYNTIAGSAAGQSLTTGSYNVYNGWGAGYGAGGSNSNNVYLGSLAGDSKSESFRLRIHSATGFGATPIIYGEFDNRVLRFDVNSLSIGSTNANARSQLHLQSTSKGFLPNVLTTAQRDAVSWVAGDAGMIIYNSTTNKHQGWNGTTWNDMY